MQIVWGGSGNAEINRALAEWCAVQIGLPRPFEEPYTTMGVFDGKTLVACMLYNNYQPEAGVIEIHGAGITPRWLTRPVLRAMFEYPFVQLGCQNLVMRVSERNRRLKRILTAYGFEHVTIPRLRGRDENECIYWLTDDAWRANGFHKEHADGQAKIANAARSARDFSGQHINECRHCDCKCVARKHQRDRPGWLDAS